MNLKRYESYIDFIYWKKNQKTKINPTNYDKKWILYAAAIAINQEQTQKTCKNIKKLRLL